MFLDTKTTDWTEINLSVSWGTSPSLDGNKKNHKFMEWWVLVTTSQRGQRRVTIVLSRVLPESSRVPVFFRAVSNHRQCVNQRRPDADDTRPRATRTDTQPQKSEIGDENRWRLDQMTSPFHHRLPNRVRSVQKTRARLTARLSIAPIRIARQRENAPPVENKIKMPSISDSLMSVMKSTCSPRLVARPVFDPTSHRSIDCWPAISHQLDRCIGALLSCRPERNYSTHQPSSLIESVVPLTIFWPAGGRPNFWFSFNSFGEYKKDLRPVKELVPNKISKRFRWWLPMEIVSPGSFVSRCHSNDKIKKESPALK